MNKRFISILSLSLSLPPLSSMSAIPLSLRGLRRIIGLVFLILFNIIPGHCLGMLMVLYTFSIFGHFIMTFSGDYVGFNLGRSSSGSCMMRLAGMGIVDPVYTTISQRCFHITPPPPPRKTTRLPWRTK